MDWYHKPTWSGRYLCYGSHLPTYKRNTIPLLIRKILELADPEFHVNNFKLLNETLVINRYPMKLIKDMKKVTIEKFKGSNQNSQNLDLHKHAKDLINMVAIPFSNELFQQIKNELKNMKSMCWPNLKMNIFSNVKDKTPILEQTNVVYEVPCECKDPCRSKTKQRLGTGLYKQKYHISKNNEKYSGLCEYIINTGHRPR